MIPVLICILETRMKAGFWTNKRRLTRLASFSIAKMHFHWCNQLARVSRAGRKSNVVNTGVTAIFGVFLVLLGSDPRTVTHFVEGDCYYLPNSFSGVPYIGASWKNSLTAGTTLVFVTTRQITDAVEFTALSSRSVSGQSTMPVPEL